MATSGSVDYTQTRNDIIHDALQLIGVYGVGRTISSEDLVFCSSMLNKMVKAWQAKGIHLWAKEEAVLFVDKNVGEYTLGSGASNARATKWSDAVLTLLNGALTASATSVTVDTTTGMASSDAVGIVLTDGTLHWDTISSVDSATTLTLTTGVASAASDNANVYTYTSKINKPLRLHSMRRVQGIDSSTTDSASSAIPMIELSHSDYHDQPNKGTNGNTTHWYYKPEATEGRLSLWPRPDTHNLYFRFTYSRMLEDFDLAGNNPDFPVEWLECLTYQLALRVAPAFGKEQKAQVAIMPMAQSMLQDMLNWDTETVSLYLMPDEDFE